MRISDWSSDVCSSDLNSGGFGSLGRLVAEAQTPLRTVELDVLNEDNAALYWSRDSRYDTVLNLNFAGAGLDALCRVLERWIAHFYGIAVSDRKSTRLNSSH